MQTQRSKHPDECPTCEGFGYTRATATEYEIDGPNAPGQYNTTARGSGCPNCHGTGRLEVARAN